MKTMSMHGRTILVTRTRRQAGSFTSLLEARGATVIEVPTIEIVPAPAEELDQAIARLDRYNWLFFTSVNAVEIFFTRLPEGQLTPPICSIGPATSERIRAFGGKVELQPSLYQAEGILEEFAAFCARDGIEGLRILLPRARIARETLPQQLRALGAEVDVVAVYETVVPRNSRQRREALLGSALPDLVTFTSSSTVRHFMELADGIEGIEQIPCAVIGPITESTAQDFHLKVVCRAERSTVPDLVEAIVRYFESRNSFGGSV